MAETVSQGKKPIVPFAPLVTSWAAPFSSITETPAFKLIYSNSIQIEYFKQTKRPMVVEDVLKSKRFLDFYKTLEPGDPVDYARLRKDIEKIRRYYARSNRRQFEKIDELLAKHIPYLYNVVRFIVHDLYVNMLKRYYQPSGDIPFLTLLKTPIDEYLVEVTKFRQTFNARLVFEVQWGQYRDAAIEQTNLFLPFKTAPDTASAITNMNYLLELGARRRSDELRRRGVHRDVSQAQIQHVRATNIANLPRQLGELARRVTTREDFEHMARTQFQMNLQNWNPAATRENLRAELQRLGTRVHPDGWTEDGGETEF